MKPLSALAAAMLFSATSAQAQVSLQLVAPGEVAEHQPQLAVYLVATNLTDHRVMLARDPQALNTDGWNLDIYCDGLRMQSDPTTVGYVAPALCQWLGLEPVVLDPKESRWIPFYIAGFLDYSTSQSCKITLRYEPPQSTAECEERIKSQYNLPMEYLASKPLTASLSFGNQVTADDSRLVADYLAWKAATDKKPSIPGEKVTLVQLRRYLRTAGTVTAYPGSAVAAWALVERIQNGADHYGGRFSNPSDSFRYLPQSRAEYRSRAKETAASERGLQELIEDCCLLLRNHPHLEPVCTWARLNLGGLLYISGDTPAAKEQLGEVAKAHPDWDEGKAARQILEAIAISSTDAPLVRQEPAPPIKDK